MFFDFSKRSQIRELMDDFCSNEEELFRTLKQFKSINQVFSGMDGLINYEIIKKCKAIGHRQITVMDLGAGGGDWSNRIIAFCRQASIDVKIKCIDYDKRIVRFLQDRFKEKKEVTIIHGDVFNENVWTDPVDFIVGNHILHHLTDESIVRLLKLCFSKVRYGFFFNDLKRSRINWLLFGLTAMIFYRNSFVLKDGTASIRKGFTHKELYEYVSLAGLHPQAGVRKTGLGHLCIVVNRTTSMNQNVFPDNNLKITRNIPI